ncbi:MAG: YDG domain-containing protein, partial [Faecalibacterium sp.]
SGSGAGSGGGGSYYTAAGDGGTVSVRDATVTVTGGAASNSYSGSGAGIGGGGSYNNTGGSGGNVTINSGTVTASGGSGSWSGAGIGSGRKYNTTLSVSGTVTIASSMGYGTSTTSVAEITAYTISTGAELSDFSTNQYAKAQVIALDWSIAINQTFADGASSYTYGDVISLTATVTETIDTDAVLTYQWYSCDSAESSGTMITDATKDTLTLSSLNASTYYYYCVVSRTSDDITVIVTSDIETVTINVKALADSMIAAIDDQPYTGSAITPTITVSDGDPSIITENDYSVAYNTNTNVGTATVTITATDGGNYTGTASANFTIVQSSTSFGDDDLTVDDDVTDNTYTYGDTVSITITPEATGEAAVQTNDMIASRASFSLDAADADQTSLYDTAPTTDQMALYATIDGVEIQLCEPVDASDDDGSYTLTYDTTDKLLAVGTHTITAKYVGNVNMADYSETFEITIVAKSVTATYVGDDITKVYDTSTDVTSTVAWEIAADDLAVDTDEITVTAIATYASADVADGIAIDFSDLATGGAQMSYYNVSLPTGITGNITTRTVTSDDITITLDTTRYTYNGTAKTPSVSIVDNTYGNTIAAGEYTISYSSNTSVGTATVTITDVDGGNYDVSGSTTFTIAAASTSTATVTEWYIVTLSTNGGGTLAPELGCFEIVAMQEGTSYTFSITPYSGYAISAVYVDGTNIGAVSEYTIDSLNSNRSIHVDFVSASVSADAEDATDEVEEDTVDVPEDTTVATEADDVADSVSTEDADDVDASTDEEETTEAAVSESDRKSGSTLPIVGGIVAAVAVLGGIGYFLFKRKNGFDGED